jgi:pyridinium-3,5-biscarboxylic acid mononucleotide sulfurtransferase
VSGDLARLEQVISTAESAIVAFSGGVDSSLVAATAHRVLGARALAVTAVSPGLATGELDGARAVAGHIGIAHRPIETNELDRPGYRSNGSDRCYHCKSELYEALAALAATEGFSALLSGANADDLGDWRPGLRAAAEHRVRHPLVEAGLGKPQIRTLARELRLPSAEKPAMPCLASRLPFGTEVRPEVLEKVDRAEQALKAIGYRELRVRHFGDRARVELGGDDLGRADAQAISDAVRKAAGYLEVAVAEEPLRSGSLHGLGRGR